MPSITDTQTIELIGRNRLVSELLQAGLEVALPQRDRGIDLIAYLDIKKDAKKFIARPIQMKAASKRSFSIHKRMRQFNGLLLVYVWYLSDLNQAQTYALTYAEAFTITKKMGYTKTKSFKKDGRFSSSSPSKELCALLDPYKMNPEKWKQKITIL